MNTKSLPIHLLLLLPTLLLPAVVLAGPDGAEAITVQSVNESVRHLASDALEGRGSGAKGGRLAGDWLAEQCKALGLQPGGEDGTYFQTFAGQGQTMRNVVATIPGREVGEMIVIGAHYDHLGLGHQTGSLDFGRSKGVIHNGADDNASGTAAILEVARAFAASGHKPRRRVTFVWFDGEERGLLGSAAFVKSPPVADKVVLMINLDMVGKLKGALKIYGATTGGDLLDGWIDRGNEGVGLELDKLDVINSSSDHANFYKKKVPVLVPFTGLHKDYHRPGDDSDAINMEGIAQIAKWTYGVAYAAAEAEQTATFATARDNTMEAMMEQLRAMFGGQGGPDLSKLFGGDGEGFDLSKLFGGGGDGEGGPLARLRELFGNARGRRRGRPRLGVSIDQAAEGGAAVTRVTPDSVAEKAGLKEGDLITGFGGESVDGFNTLLRLVGEAKGTVTVEVTRGEETLSLTAEFGEAKPPAARRTRPKVERKPTPTPKGPRWF